MQSISFWIKQCGKAFLREIKGINLLVFYFPIFKLKYDADNYDYFKIFLKNLDSDFFRNFTRFFLSFGCWTSPLLFVNVMMKRSSNGYVMRNNIKYKVKRFCLEIIQTEKVYHWGYVILKYRMDPFYQSTFLILTTPPPLKTFVGFFI